MRETKKNFRLIIKDFSAYTYLKEFWENLRKRFKNMQIESFLFTIGAVYVYIIQKKQELNPKT